MHKQQKPNRASTEARLPQGLGVAIATHLDAYFHSHGNLLPDKGLYGRVIREIEKPLIMKTLEITGGHQAKTAAILGIHRNTLRKKIQELGLIESE